MQSSQKIERKGRTKFRMTAKDSENTAGKQVNYEDYADEDDLDPRFIRSSRDVRMD